jgi:hypothetical protein
MTAAHQQSDARAALLQALLPPIGLAHGLAAVGLFTYFREWIDKMPWSVVTGTTTFMDLIQSPYFALLALAYLGNYCVQCLSAAAHYKDRRTATRLALRRQGLARMYDEGYQQLLAEQVARAVPLAAPLVVRRESLYERLELVAAFDSALEYVDFYPERLTAQRCLAPLATLWVGTAARGRQQPSDGATRGMRWLLLLPVRVLSAAAAVLLAAPLALSLLEAQLVLEGTLNLLAAKQPAARERGGP